jgi:type II secretory pathway pseudopilin PulG
MELFKMKNQRGSMIVVVIMILALLSIMGASSIRTSNTELEIASNNLIRKRCFYNAESGINSALRLLPSVLDNEDQIDNATLDWEGNISNADSPPFYDVSFRHKTQSGGRWTPKTGQGAKLYVRVLKGGTDNGKNQKKAQSAI